MVLDQVVYGKLVHAGDGFAQKSEKLFVFFFFILAVLRSLVEVFGLCLVLLALQLLSFMFSILVLLPLKFILFL